MSALTHQRFTGCPVCFSVPMSTGTVTGKGTAIREYQNWNREHRVLIRLGDGRTVDVDHSTVQFDYNQEED